MSQKDKPVHIWGNSAQDDEVRQKLQKLRSFKPFVDNIISKLEKRNSQNEAEKLKKMRMLQKFILEQEKSCSKLGTIERMIRLLEGIQQRDNSADSAKSTGSSSSGAKTSSSDTFPKTSKADSVNWDNSNKRNSFSQGSKESAAMPNPGRMLSSPVEGKANKPSPSYSGHKSRPEQEQFSREKGSANFERARNNLNKMKSAFAGSGLTSGADKSSKVFPCKQDSRSSSNDKKLHVSHLNDQIKNIPITLDDNPFSEAPLDPFKDMGFKNWSTQNSPSQNRNIPSPVVDNWQDSTNLNSILMKSKKFCDEKNSSSVSHKELLASLQNEKASFSKKFAEWSSSSTPPSEIITSKEEKSKQAVHSQEEKSKQAAHSQEEKYKQAAHSQEEKIHFQSSREKLQKMFGIKSKAKDIPEKPRQRIQIPKELSDLLRLSMPSSSDSSSTSVIGSKNALNEPLEGDRLEKNANFKSVASSSKVNTSQRNTSILDPLSVIPSTPESPPNTVVIDDPESPPAEETGIPMSPDNKNLNNSSRSLYSVEDTPVSPEPEECPSTNATHSDFSVKTIPMEKVVSSTNIESTTRKKNFATSFPQQTHHKVDDNLKNNQNSPSLDPSVLRYEDFVKPVYQRNPPLRNPGFQSSNSAANSVPKPNIPLDITTVDPQHIPKPPPLPSALHTGIDSSPVKRTYAIDSDSPYASSSSANVNFPKLDLSTPTLQKSSNKSQKSSGSLNIEEYRRRRQQKLSQKSGDSPEPPPDNVLRHDYSGRTTPTNNRFESQQPDRFSNWNSGSQPHHSLRHSEVVGPSTVRNRDPRSLEARSMAPGCDPMISHQPRPLMSLDTQRFPHHASPYLRGNPRLHNIDPRNRPHPMHQRFTGHTPHRLPMQRPHQSHFRSFPSPQGNFGRMPPNYAGNQHPLNNPYGPPMPFQALYGMGYPQPSSPTPPPPSACLSEPVKKVSASLSHSFTCIMMKGLPYYANSLHIYKFFQDFILKDISIALDRDFKCTDSAYVCFPSHDSAANSVQELNGFLMHGCQISLTPVPNGFFKSAKENYRQRNNERERSLGIAALPPGNCNPFYDPKRIEEKLAKKKQEEESKQKLADKVVSTSSSVETQETTPEIPVTESSQVSENLAVLKNETEKESPTKTPDILSSEEHKIKKNRRYGRMIVDSDSESESNDDKMANEESLVSSPLLDNDLDDVTEAESPEAEVQLNLHQNSFDFPDLEVEGNQDGFDISYKDDLLEFEDAVDKFDDVESTSVNEVIEKDAASDNVPKTIFPSPPGKRHDQSPLAKRSKGKSSAPKVGSSPSASQRPKRKPKNDQDLSKFMTKMTRNTQCQVEKVCPEGSRLKVLIPEPKSIITPLFVDRASNFRGKRGSCKSVLFPSANSGGSEGMPYREVPEQSFVTVNERASSSDHDSLMIDLDQKTNSDRDDAFENNDTSLTVNVACETDSSVSKSRIENIDTSADSLVSSPVPLQIHCSEGNISSCDLPLNSFHSPSPESNFSDKFIPPSAKDLLENSKNHPETHKPSSPERMVAPDSTIEDDDLNFSISQEPSSKDNKDPAKGPRVDSSLESNDELQVIEMKVKTETFDIDSNDEPDSKVSKSARVSIEPALTTTGTFTSEKIGSSKTPLSVTIDSSDDESSKMIPTPSGKSSNSFEKGKFGSPHNKFSQNSIILIDSDSEDEKNENIKKPCSSISNPIHEKHHDKENTEVMSEKGLPHQVDDNSDKGQNLLNQTADLLDGKSDIFSSTNLDDDDTDISQLVPSLGPDDSSMNAIADLSNSKSVLSILEGSPIPPSGLGNQAVEFDDDENNMDVSAEIDDIVDNLDKTKNAEVDSASCNNIEERDKERTAQVKKNFPDSIITSAKPAEDEKVLEGPSESLLKISTDPFSAALHSKVMQNDPKKPIPEQLERNELQTSIETEELSVPVAPTPTVLQDKDSNKVCESSIIDKVVAADKKNLESSLEGNLLGGSKPLVVLDKLPLYQMKSSTVEAGDDHQQPPEFGSTLVSDDDLESTSSFKDDSSIISGESRDLKTPDSGLRRKKRKENRSAERKRVTRGSIVEKVEVNETVHWDDGGVVDLFQCDVCSYVGRHQVNHIINNHAERQITCYFKKEDLSTVYREKVGPPPDFENCENVDLSWVPPGLDFDNPVTCSEEDCDYISGKRFDLLYHFLEHNPKAMSSLFHCRLCHYMSNNLEDSYNHFTSHTGEYRYECSKCGFMAYNSERIDEHNASSHEGTSSYTCSKMVLEEGWPYIYICKICYFTQVQFSKVEAHNIAQHFGKGEVYKTNMFRNITLHGEKHSRLPSVKERSKGKKSKKAKIMEMKVFLGKSEDDDCEVNEREAKLLVDRISQNIYTTRTAGEIKLKIHQLDSISKKLEAVINDEEKDEGSECVQQGSPQFPSESEQSNKLISHEDSTKDVNSEGYVPLRNSDYAEASNAENSESNKHKSESTTSLVVRGSDSVSADKNLHSSHSDPIQNKVLPSDNSGALSLSDEKSIVSETSAAASNPVANVSSSNSDDDSSDDESRMVIDEGAGEEEEESSEEDSLMSSLGVMSGGEEVPAGGDSEAESLISKLKRALHERDKDPHLQEFRVKAVPKDKSMAKVRVRCASELVDPNLHEPKSHPYLLICCSQPGCLHKCQSQEELVKHELLSHGPYKCSFYFCNFITHLEEQFVVHYQTHPKTNKYGCGYGCSSTVESVQDLIQHYKSGSCSAACLNTEAAGESTCGLRIESVSTIDPSSAAQLFGNDSVCTPTYTGSATLSTASTVVGGPSADHPRPAANCQPYSTTLFPSSTIFPANFSQSSASSSPTHTAPPVESPPLPQLGAKEAPPKPITVKSECQSGADPFVEELPHGFNLLPRDPPTVPILFIFQQYQTVSAFKLYTGKKAADVFKCMYRGCIFTANDPEVFRNHSIRHLDQFRCCYCMLHFTNANSLVEHVLEEHSHCSFMCKHCLYRSTFTVYLGSHIRQFHPKEQPRYVKVNTINKGPPPNPPVEKFIHSYQCGFDGCPKRTVDAEMFKSHVTSAHGPDVILKCFLCAHPATVSDLVEHMRMHMMDEFQCPYCLHGEPQRDKLTSHLVICHPGRSGKVLLRKHSQPESRTTTSRSTSPDTNTPIKQTSALTTAVSTPSGIPDNSSKYFGLVSNAPRTGDSPTLANSSIDVMGSPLNLGSSPSHSLSSVSCPSNIPVTTQPSSEGPKTSSTETSTLNFINKFQEVLTPTTSSDTAYDQSEEEKSASREGTKQSLEPEALSSEEPALPTSVSDKVGLAGFDLYRCGNKLCSFASASLVGLREHLQVCDNARNTPTLHCYHCSRQFRHVSALLEHIKVHGPKRYYCAVPGCTYRATMHHYFRNHAKQIHGTSVFRCDIKDPTVKDPELQEFLVIPKDSTGPNKDTHKKRKNEYDVTDLDKIPRAHVSYTPLKCYHCPFSSKIRLNLVKHLNLHKKYPGGIPQRSQQLEVKEESILPLPNKQPVNPVPCLKNKELMFDKMMNLAGSSFEDKKKLEEVDLRLKNPIPQEEYDNLPQFVPESSVNVCGVPGCEYTSISEVMLKHHIRALHSDVASFPCKHCKNVTLTVEKINAHFKLHGERLYRCGWCPHLSFRRAVVERHTREKHPSRTPFEFVIRDPDENKEENIKSEEAESASSDVPSTSKTNPEQKVPEKVENPEWMCGLCTYQSVTLHSMVNHASLKHDVKSQYKCGHCNFKSSVLTSFDGHYNSKHQNLEYSVHCMYYRTDADDIVPLNKDLSSKGRNEPLWKRNNPDRVKQIRGILLEDSAVEAKHKPQAEQAPLSDFEPGLPDGDNFVCPKCTTFKNPNVDTFRSHLCKEADYHRYECTECGFTTALLPSLRRHYNNKHHSQFLNDSYLLLPIDEEKEAWVESIISHQIHLIKQQQERKFTPTERKSTSSEKKALPTDSATNSSPPEAMTPPSTSSQSRSLRFSRRNSRDMTNEDLSPQPTSDPPSSTRYTCAHCGFGCRTSAGLANHTRANHMGRYKCGHCPYASDSFPQLQNHYVTKHPEVPLNISDSSSVTETPENSSICPTADSELSGDDSKFRSPSTSPAKPRKVHQCPDCPFQTFSSKQYYKHCKLHISNRPYLCKACETRFRDNKAAKQHVRLTHPDNADCIIFSPVRDSSPVSFSPPPQTSTESTDPHQDPLQLSAGAAPKPFLIDEEFDELPDLEASDFPQAPKTLKEEPEDINEEKKPVLSAAAPTPPERKKTGVKRRSNAGPASKKRKLQQNVNVPTSVTSQSDVEKGQQSGKKSPEPASPVNPPVVSLSGMKNPNVPSSTETMKRSTLDDLGDVPGVTFCCCHCNFESEKLAMVQHIRSQHGDMPFLLRRKMKGCVWLDIFNYSCDHCSHDSKSLQEAVDHWMKQHIILTLNFTNTLKSSQLISGEPGLSTTENAEECPVNQIKIEDTDRGDAMSDDQTSGPKISSVSNKRSISEAMGSSRSAEASKTYPKRMKLKDPLPLQSDTDLDTSTSELDTTQEECIDEKLFRCSSCRRTAKTRQEIVTHQQEKHEGASWCSVIDLTNCGNWRSQRRLVKCGVCSYVGYREPVTIHSLSQHPHLKEPSIMPLLKTDKDIFRCDSCCYSSKTRRNMQKHVSSSHGAEGSFSRYAVQQATAAAAVGLDSSLPNTSTATDDSASCSSLLADDVKGGKYYNDAFYRCEYCDEIIQSYNLLKEHHDFLHSHLPFTSLPNDHDNDLPKEQESGRSSSLSSARHGLTANLYESSKSRVKATARKSTSPKTLQKLRRAKLRRNVASKSSRGGVKGLWSARKAGGTKQGALESAGREELPSLTSSLLADYGNITAPIDFPGSGPVMLRYSEIQAMFDINPKVVLSDISLICKFRSPYLK